MLDLLHREASGRLANLRHPCLHDDSHGNCARIHLPVAPRCNVRCAYCRGGFAPGESLDGPGAAAGVITPHAAVLEAVAFTREHGEDAVIGVAGPGDPLANPETLETLRLVRRRLPRARLCLCTNGLALPEALPELLPLRLLSLSVTVNGTRPESAARLTPLVLAGGRLLRGAEGAARLLAAQRAGIAAAASGGVVVKVNMVVAPGINDAEAEDVARMAASLGASVFNPMPLIPRGALAHVPAPCHELMQTIRERASRHLPVFTRCRQCRADARGVPGTEDFPCRSTTA